MSVKILITGGMGFIGSHLAKKYQSSCAKIYLIDNLSTNAISPECDFIKVNENIHFIQMDLSSLSNKDLEQLEKILSEVSLVYHFASPVGVKYLDGKPKEAVRSLFFTTATLFPLFEKYSNKVIYASTSEVYGENTLAKESDILNIGSPTQLRWGYSCGKLMSEFMLHSFNFPFVILRFFNVTGAGQLFNYGMVLPNLVDQALRNEDLVVFDQGLQTRCFCDIRDAIEMIHLLSHSPDYESETFNIGNANNELSILELAELILKTTKSSSRITHKEFDKVYSKNIGEIYKRKLDNTKIGTIYECRYDLNDIVTSYVKAKEEVL